MEKKLPGIQRKSDETVLEGWIRVFNGEEISLNNDQVKWSNTFNNVQKQQNDAESTKWLEAFNK